MPDDNIPLTPISPPGYGPPPQQIIVQQQPPSIFGRFGKWLLAALVILVLVIISLNSAYQSYFTPPGQPQERYHSLSRFASKKIAVIDISGAILEGEESFAKKQIDRVREDDSVVGVVLRINSPGGTVTGSDYIYHHLRDLAEDRNMPMVVSMGSVCASGGYYIAMAVGNQANSIYAEPTTWTGSIGVIIPHMDFSQALIALKIEDDSIASGPLKEMGSPTKPMSEEERKVLQTLVNESFAGFKDIIKSGRPKFKDDPAALDKVATGQIFTAKQALGHGLIDRVGFVEEAIGRVLELSGETDDSVRCVTYEEPPTLLSVLAGADSQVSASRTSPIKTLIDIATPRPYYLWSWLPTISSTAR